MNKIEEFLKAKKNILKYFGINENYFIKTCTSCKWTIKIVDEIYFLNYWENKKDIQRCVIVKKEGKPQIMEKGSTTMIIAIECVKIAIILNNSLRT